MEHGPFTATCPDLDLTNGVISYSPDTTSRLEGTVATHSCVDGYVLSGGTERTCQSNRTWNGGNITCEGKHLLHTPSSPSYTRQLHAPETGNMLPEYVEDLSNRSTCYVVGCYCFQFCGHACIDNHKSDYLEMGRCFNVQGN